MGEIFVYTCVTYIHPNINTYIALLFTFYILPGGVEDRKSEGE
jgi:hypothetical protein